MNKNRIRGVLKRGLDGELQMRKNHHGEELETSESHQLPVQQLKSHPPHGISVIGERDAEVVQNQGHSIPVPWRIRMQANAVYGIHEAAGSSKLQPKAKPDSYDYITIVA